MCMKYCWGCRTYCNYDVFFKAYICRCGKEEIEDEEEEIEEIESGSKEELELESEEIKEIIEIEEDIEKAGD